MFRQFRLLRRLIRYGRHNRPKTVNCRKFKHLPKVNLLIGTQICCTHVMINEDEQGGEDDQIENVNLEEDITKALQEGDAAIIKLMDQLKHFVIIVSEEYRNCMMKQIEIMQKAMDVGPFSELWDELPQYRTLAGELNKELTEYCTLFNTLDALARNRSRIDCPGGSEANSIFNKFREIQNFIEKEVDENKKIEKELLKAVTDTIINEVHYVPTPEKTEQ